MPHSVPVPPTGLQALILVSIRLLQVHLGRKANKQTSVALVFRSTHSLRTPKNTQNVSFPWPTVQWSGMP